MRILTVDDEFVALEKMKMMLSDYGKCDTAVDGAEACKKFSQAINSGNPYGLVTIDIEMPEIGGFELLHMLDGLERDSNYPTAKKIIITSSGSQSNVIKAAKRKCNAFLVKPVKKEVLEVKLKELSIPRMVVT